MASTIQIKHGSGSNTPAAGALTNAELALNVDTGQLWYGSGSSPVTQSEFKFLNITASSATGSFTGSFTGTFTDADVTALKLQSASLLTYTASNNASITSLKTITASLIAEDTALKTITASLIAEDTSLKTITASLIAEDTSLKTITASLIAEDTSLKTITASLIAEDTALKTKTASLDASITSFKLETASLHTFTASGFQSPLSMSVGTTLSNTTNIAGNVLYAHGNVSASGAIYGSNFRTSGAYRLLDAGGTYRHILTNGADDLTIEIGNVNMTSGVSITGNLTGSANISASGATMAATASFGAPASNTTNIAGVPLYVHGNISASNNIIGSLIEGNDIVASRQISSSAKLMSLTASFGTVTSETTNPSGVPLYVHGRISASGNIYGLGLHGTLGTAAQTNITSLGTLNGLTAESAIDFSDAESIDFPDAVNITIPKHTITSASVGTTLSNTTNTAGNVLYVHGNASASGKIMSSTASFGAPASNTTNIAGTALYAHGNVSASGNILGIQYEQIASNFSSNVNNATNNFIYMPFAEQSTTENEGKANLNINRVAVTSGRPIRTIVRATADTLGDSTAYTMSCHYMRTGSTAEVHMTSVYGTTDSDSNKDAIIFNWADADSGSHDFFMTGDRMLVGIRNTNNQTTGYIVTHMWEWDYNLIQ